MTKKISSIVMGLLFVAAGIILVGNVANLWSIEIFFRGWWTLFIIIPSLVGLLDKNTLTSSILGLSIGTLLLLSARGIIAWALVGKLFIPIMLIVIGFNIIFASGKKHGFVKKEGAKGGKIPSYLAVFSGTEDRIKNEEFEGAELVSVFGGTELDLTEAKIEKDVYIHSVAIFGGNEIILPANVKVKVTGVPIFGGIENKARQIETENAPTVYIDHVSIFGGTDIK